MSLSPTTSIHSHHGHGKTHTIREEPDIEQEEPLEHPIEDKYAEQLEDGTTMLPQYDNDTDDQEIVVPTQQSQSHSSLHSASIASTKPSRAKRTSSVPVRGRHPPPPPLTQLGSYRSIHYNTGSDDAGYASPGIISPGGGIPSLQLQNSHSLELRNDDAVAVVEDMMMARKAENNTSTNVDVDADAAGSAKENKESPHNQKQPQSQSQPQHEVLDLNLNRSSSRSQGQGGAAGSAAIMKQRNLSPTANNVYSWVFKPADDKDKAEETEQIEG